MYVCACGAFEFVVCLKQDSKYNVEVYIHMCSEHACGEGITANTRMPVSFILFLLPSNFPPCSTKFRMIRCSFVPFNS